MAARKPRQDRDREERIAMEIVVDAYGAEEQAMGWYYYLEDKLQFPFVAVCRSRRATSPLVIHDEVEVVGMAPEEECEHEMLVRIRRGTDELAVPLSQLTANDAVRTSTNEAIGDWHYWVEMGYRFG